MCRLLSPDESSPVTPVKQWCFTHLLSGLFTRDTNVASESPVLVLDGTCCCIGECCCVSKSKHNLLTIMPASDARSVSVASANGTTVSCSTRASPESSGGTSSSLRRRASQASHLSRVIPEVTLSPKPQSLTTESQQKIVQASSDCVSQRRGDGHDISSLGLAHLLSPAGGCLYFVADFMRLFLAYT